MGGPGERLGLIAGSGSLPRLVARAAREAGRNVVALAHLGETDASLEADVDALIWVRIGQLDRMHRLLRERGVRQVTLAGGIGRLRALKEARPDFGALRVLAQLRSLRDDALLRGIARDFEAHGFQVLSPAEIAPRLLAAEGQLAGPKLDPAQARDVALGFEIAGLLGKADVGQTVVVKGGLVLALEAIEGTDAAIRRGGELGGPGAVVVKRCKPGQDVRLDLPAVGLKTIASLSAVKARVLAIEAGRTLLLDGEALFREAERAGISVVGISPAN